MLTRGDRVLTRAAHTSAWSQPRLLCASSLCSPMMTKGRCGSSPRTWPAAPPAVLLRAPRLHLAVRQRGAQQVMAASGAVLPPGGLRVTHSGSKELGDVERDPVDGTWSASLQAPEWRMYCRTEHEAARVYNEAALTAYQQGWLTRAPQLNSNLPKETDVPAQRHWDSASVAPKSQFRGVYWDRTHAKWLVSLHIPKWRETGFESGQEAQKRLREVVRQMRSQGWVPEVNKRKTSQYFGVYRETSGQRWVAQMRVDGKRCYLGVYSEQQEAAEAVDKELLRLRKAGHKAGARPLNFPGRTYDLTAVLAEPLRVTQVRPRKSKYMGVYRQPNRSNWLSRTQVNGYPLYLGLFDSEEEAARARDQAVVAAMAANPQHKKRYRLNFPQDYGL